MNYPKATSIPGSKVCCSMLCYSQRKEESQLKQLNIPCYQIFYICLYVHDSPKQWKVKVVVVTTGLYHCGNMEINDRGRKQRGRGKKRNCIMGNNKNRTIQSVNETNTFTEAMTQQLKNVYSSHQHMETFQDIRPQSRLSKL